MAFREISMVQVSEVLRLWMKGHGIRPVAKLTGIDRKTVRRYVEAARRAGLRREDDVGRIDEGLIGEVIEAVRPSGPESHGESWRLCESNRELLQAWVDEELRLTKISELFDRRMAEPVPYRTLHRFAVEELGFGKKRVTVRVEDGEPGRELQVDFGRLGFLLEEANGRRRVVWGLVFTAVVSRHQFVWPTFGQAMPDVIEGFERAWEFFGGVFPVVIPDNMKAIVDRADSCAPRLNDTFVEYAQARGFVIDPARVRTPTDKPRVERQVPYVRESFFRGEAFRDLEDVRERAERWCRETAGTRTHGTTRRRPIEAFDLDERAKLLPGPTERYEIPLHADVTVGRDHHLTIGQALYSVPTAYIGQAVHARADRQLVKVSCHGQLIKTHPRQPPGGRSTDPEDYPREKAIYATRNAGALQMLADDAAPTIGVYASRLLEGPLPWTRMRHVYRLLGFVRRYGVERVERACERTLEFDVVDIVRLGRILEKALESPGDGPPEPRGALVGPWRFERSVAEFRSVSREQRKVESDER